MPIRVTEQRIFNPLQNIVTVHPTTASATGAVLLGAPESIPTPSIVYGFNFSTSLFEWFGGAAPGTTAVSENGAQLVSRLKGTYGLSLIPIMKAYPNNVPTSWNTTWDNCEGNRMILTLRPNSTMANMAAGSDDAAFRALCQSVPSPKHVRFVIDNEPETRIGVSYTVADFHAVYSRFFAICEEESTPTKRLEMWTCFQIPFQVPNHTTSDYLTWLPDPSICHGYGWDGYLNKFGVKGPTGAVGDASSYQPSYPSRFASALSVTQSKGQTRLGVMEIGAPPRTWDDGSWPASPWFSDAPLKGRLHYLAEAFDYCESVQGMEFVIPFNSYNKNAGSQDQRWIMGGRPTNGNGSSSTSPFPAFAHMSVSPYPTNEPSAIEISNRLKANQTAYTGG